MNQTTYNLLAQCFARFDWNYRKITPIGVVPDTDSFVTEVNLNDANAGGVAGNGLAFSVYHALISLTHGGLPTIIDLSGNTGFMSGAYCVYDSFGKLFRTTAVKAVLVNNLGIPGGSDGCGCGGTTYDLAPGFNAIIGNPNGSLANWAAPFSTGYGTYNFQGSLGVAPGGWAAFACPNQDLPVGTLSESPGCLLEISYGGSVSSSAQTDCDLVIIA